MKSRGKLSRRVNRREFRKGDKTHVKNIAPNPARGGIRL